MKETVGGGASSGAVPPASKLDTLLEKVKAPGFSLMEEIDGIVNGINSRRKDVMLLKTARTWVLLAPVVAGFAFGSGWTQHAPRKHLVKEERMKEAKKHLHQDQTML